MKMNWKQGDKERVLYPEGTYKVRVDKWEYTTASTGTEQIRWYGTVVDHDKFDGKSIVCHTPLTEQSLWKIATFMACHVDVSKLQDMEVRSSAWEGVINIALGRTMYWRMSQSSYNGKQNNKAEEFTRCEPLAEISIAVDTEPEFLNEL